MIAEKGVIKLRFHNDQGYTGVLISR